MMIGPGLRRMISFAKLVEKKEENEQILATIVRELSGDWITWIECEAIQNEDRIFYDQVVYFGEGSDLQEGGKAEVLNRVSMADRYNFDEQRLGFYWNSDPDCRRDRRLNEDSNYIVFFNGENSIPLVLLLGL